jgi:hypothetical protein
MGRLIDTKYLAHHGDVLRTSVANEEQDGVAR